MGKPVAKEGDRVVGMDTHIVLIPTPGGPVPTPMPFPFSGKLAEGLASNVYAGGHAVAVVGSSADNQPPHIPMAGPFQRTPKDKGKVAAGSGTVFADDKAVARHGDPCECCNDPDDQQTGHIIAAGDVFSG